MEVDVNGFLEHTPRSAWVMLKEGIWGEERIIGLFLLVGCLSWVVFLFDSIFRIDIFTSLPILFLFRLGLTFCVLLGQNLKTEPNDDQNRILLHILASLVTRSIWTFSDCRRSIKVRPKSGWHHHRQRYFRFSHHHTRQLCRHFVTARSAFRRAALDKCPAAARVHGAVS